MTTIHKPLLNWSTDKSAILECIKKPSLFKIFLKTKDDEFFLDEWIAHHEKIVGKENLFIFDNCSSNSKVVERIAQLSETYNIFSFDGFHNDIHNTFKYPELYDAIKKSCQFFVFLDTDERLIYVDGSEYSSGAEILDFLSERSATSVFPGLWVSNARSSRTIYNFGTELAELNFGITNGKPIINTSSPFSGFLNHNIDVGQWIEPENAERNFIILHLNKLYPAQRIASNVNKLIARKFINPGEGYDAALNRDLSGVSDANIISYVHEIAQLVTETRSTDSKYQQKRGDISFEDVSMINFDSAAEQSLLSLYLSREVTIQIDKSHRSIKLKTIDSTDPIRSYKGFIDRIDSSSVTGWAVDSDGHPCWLVITINNSYKISVLTKRSRRDLAAQGITSGLGGFTVNIENFLEENENQVRVFYPDGSQVANGVSTINVNR